METVITLLGVPFTRFGLGCALALAVYLLAMRLFSWKKTDYATFLTLCLTTIPLAWLFGRLLFVAVDLVGAVAEDSLYLNTYGDISLALRFWEGGYSLMGALLGGLLAIWLTEKAMGVKDAVLQDAAAIAIPLGILIERLAEPGTGLGEGRAVESEWFLSTGLAMQSEGYDYWPIYLLEALVMLILCILMLVRRARKSDRLPGDALRTFLTLFGLCSVVMESLRGDYHMVVHFVRAQQIVAILLVVGCMLVWSRRMKGDARMEAFCWLVTVVAIGLAVVAEFGADRWDSKLLAYGLMVLCLLAIGWMAFSLRDWSKVKRDKR